VADPTHPHVATEDLGKRFGRRWAVAHVSLRVQEGEAVLLAGPNGCGKTTLLRLLGGLYRPSAGRVELFGLDPRHHRMAVRRSFSLISHDNYLYPPLTALETVRLWARLLGHPASEDELLALLAEVDLGERSRHRVGGFSAGMRKRLTLVRARLENPRLLLLDEPLASLDSAGKRLVERWIGDHRAAGKAVVVASHAVEQMAALCDRAVLMRGGQIAWTGPAPELPSVLESAA
jgi:heme exporter protein A